VRTGPDEPIHHSSTSAPVRIGRNVWVGAKATITSGVTVGDQSIIGAHALVTRDVPPSTLVGSPPATELRRLDG
jgi:acetyltransferase-like isoleucine patch superfamily enzyme